MRPSLVASAAIFFCLTVLVTSSLDAQVSDSPGSVNCPQAVNLTVTVTTESGAVIPHAFVLLREDTLGQPRGVKVFELELRTDETGKATAAVPCNYLDVFVAHDGFAPAAQKILITIDAHTFSVPLKTYPITRTTEILISGGVPTVTAELPTISQVVTITEPGVYQLSDLFKAADIVAVVKVISGDTENYEHAVYKGEIIRSFKGVAARETVYFGPFVGEKLGWEYVLFLRNAAKAITPKTTPNASYGTVRYSEVFDQGYSSMQVSYACVFDGKEVAQQCDDGVRVCTDYIKLPKSVSAFPPEDNDPPFGCRWVRRAAFISLLDTLAGPKK